MGILAPITALLEKLASIQTTNQSGVSSGTHTRVWNNQVDKMKEGNNQYEPLPAFYLEYLSDSEFNMIGAGYLASDPVWRVHIVHENYNNADAVGTTFEQDLIIFELRDKVLKELQLFKPPGSGPLTYIGEQPSYDHDNVYEYIVDFTAHFIDDSASDDNPDNGKYIYKDPPTELEVEVHILKAGPNQLTEQDFIINGKVDRTN